LEVLGINYILGYILGRSFARAVSPQPIKPKKEIQQKRNPEQRNTCLINKNIQAPEGAWM